MMGVKNPETEGLVCWGTSCVGALADPAAHRQTKMKLTVALPVATFVNILYNAFCSCSKL